MTSTHFNVGLKEGRSSSRVLRPPGGGHTDIFGGEPEAPRGRRAIVPPASSLGHVPEKPTNNVDVHTEQPQEAQEASPQPQTPNNSANDATPEEQPAKTIIEPVEFVKVEKEFIEAPKIEEPIIEAPKIEAPKIEANKEAPKVEVPKRVRVPPGGFSSGLW